MLCTHKTTILCQFGLSCHQLTNPYLHQFSTISGGNCIRLTVSLFDSQANQSNQSSIQRELLMPSPEVIDLTLSDHETQPDPIQSNQDTFMPTRATHAQPSLSNIPKWDSNFAGPSRVTRKNFPTSPQNQNTKLTHCSIYVSIQTITFPQTNKRHSHPSWAPTKEPMMSCWRYTPSSNQDRFQDFLEAICPDF